MTSTFIGFVADESPAQLAADFGAVRVSAWTRQPFGVNAVVRAWVGAEELDGVSVDQFGLSFNGFMSAQPGPGDTLSVQIDLGDKVDTGLTVESVTSTEDPIG